MRNCSKPNESMRFCAVSNFSSSPIGEDDSFGLEQFLILTSKSELYTIRTYSLAPGYFFVFLHLQEIFRRQRRCDKAERPEMAYVTGGNFLRERYLQISAPVR